MTIFSLS